MFYPVICCFYFDIMAYKYRHGEKFCVILSSGAMVYGYILKVLTDKIVN